jgi:hypothetical protein
MMTWHLDDGTLNLLEVTLHLEDEMLHHLEGTFYFEAPSHTLSPILRAANFRSNYCLTEYRDLCQLIVNRCRITMGFPKSGDNRNLGKNCQC